MILLASTGDLIQVISGQAVSTITVHASFVDYNGTTATPTRTNTLITTATTTTVVASPGSSIQRNVKALVIHNSHATSSCAITVQHTDSSNVVLLMTYTLLAGETIQYYDTLGFEVLDASGERKETTTIFGPAATDPYAATVFAPGQLRVAMEPTQVFFDDFSSGLDLIFRWKTPTTGTGGVAATSSPGSGGTTLASGTTANGFSSLESQPIFVPTNPGYVHVNITLAIENPVLTTGYRFWGVATTPAVPTISAPVSEAVGWDVTTAGHLCAATYAAGSRTLIADLNTSGKQPTDANPHKYFTWFRGDICYWAIDTFDNIVASFLTGASGPNINELPVKLLAVSNSGTQVTLPVSVVVIGDTGRNNVRISDTDHPWLSPSVDANGGMRVSGGFPNIIQKKSAVSSGSVASLAATFDAPNLDGNSIVVCVTVGNATAPTVTDSIGNSPYKNTINVANSTVVNASIFMVPNVFPGSRNTITVANGGSTASMAMEIYEVDGLLTVASSLDQTASATGSSGTAATAAITPTYPDELFIACVGIGTAAQTITPATGWTNDSGQLVSGGTPAGVFQTISMSQFGGGLSSITPQATFTSEPWAIVSASFKPGLIVIGGAVRLTDGATNVAVISATTALKTDLSSVAGTATVAASAGIQKVGIVGNAAAIVDGVINGAAPANVIWETGAPSTAAGAALSMALYSVSASTVIKNSTGNLYGLTLVNQSTAAMFLHIFNTTTTTSLTTGSWIGVIAIPGGAAVGVGSITFPPGHFAMKNFATGIVVLIGAAAASTTVAAGTAPTGAIWYL